MEQNIVSDAGDLLWTLTSSGVSLVLCGHRHRPWIWKLGNLPVIHAGTVSTDRLRGFYENTYSIIHIEDSKIIAHLKIPGGEKHDFDRNSIKSAKTILH
jgi:predicted phosphodiesterase